MSLDFEPWHDSPGSGCPSGWDCTDCPNCQLPGTAHNPSWADDWDGDGWLYIAGDMDIGSVKTRAFSLPEDATKLTFLRSGGADSPSGVFVKTTSDDTEVCGSTDGSNTNTFFEAECVLASGYGGQSVYILASAGDATEGDATEGVR